MADTTSSESKKVEKQEPASQASEPQRSSAGILVLQWLTYAFWGWLIIALIWLMAVVLSNFILDTSVSSVVPYAIAATLVLLPLAFVTDIFYRKHEPLKKAGGSAVVMIIHAVISALFAIGTLIASVFILLQITIETGDTDGLVVGFLTTGFAALLNAALFVRVLNPFKSSKPLFIYGISMLVVAILLLGFAIFGPLAKGIAARGDRLIEQNLNYIENGVAQYVTDNQKLPESLKDISVSTDEAQRLIDDNLVEYKKDGTATTGSGTSLITEYRYQLCVDYKQSSGSRYSSTYDNEYQSYVSTSSHKAGNVCYKLQARDYGYNVKTYSNDDN